MKITIHVFSQFLRHMERGPPLVVIVFHPDKFFVKVTRFLSFVISSILNHG